MSVENALAFLKVAEREPGLRLEMSSLRGRTAIDGLVHLGAGLGLVFTAEEYRGAVSAMANGELDEPALAAILEEVGLGKDSPYKPRQ